MVGLLGRVALSIGAVYFVIFLIGVVSGFTYNREQSLLFPSIGLGISVALLLLMTVNSPLKAMVRLLSGGALVIVLAVTYAIDGASEPFFFQLVILLIGGALMVVVEIVRRRSHSKAPYSHPGEPADAIDYREDAKRTEERYQRYLDLREKHKWDPSLNWRAGLTSEEVELVREFEDY